MSVTIKEYKTYLNKINKTWQLFICLQNTSFKFYKPIKHFLCLWKENPLINSLSICRCNYFSIFIIFSHFTKWLVLTMGKNVERKNTISASFCMKRKTTKRLLSFIYCYKAITTRLYLHKKCYNKHISLSIVMKSGWSVKNKWHCIY